MLHRVNRILTRAVLILLSIVLITTSVVSPIFAKYTQTRSIKIPLGFKPGYVEINWKSLREERLMRSQWLYDISYSLNDYDSKFNVTATEKELTSKANGVGDDRSYFSTKMYNITSKTRYEYTFEAKNNHAGGYAGVMLAYDVNGLYPYFAYGEFDNRSTEGSCIHIGCRKAHYNYDNYDWCDVTSDFTAVVKETDDGYGQYKVIYDGLNVTFYYLNTSGEYVQLGNTITLPQGSKVCVGVYSCNGSDRTVSLRNCVLTAKNYETIKCLEGEIISLVKTFKLKVATFDISKASYENPPHTSFTKIVAAIKASGADIIGLQAVDYQTNRSGKIDQAAEIARLAGYDYHWTFKAINFDGGSYGVAIISKYKLGAVDQINLSSGGAEQRILANVGLRLHNEVINLFVTHLSPASDNNVYKDHQFVEIANRIAKYQNVILMGDFNLQKWSQFDPIVNRGFLLVNKQDASVNTYRLGNAALDNIVHSKIFTSSGGKVVESTASDHYLLYTTLTYRQQEPQ